MRSSERAWTRWRRSGRSSASSTRLTPRSPVAGSPGEAATLATKSDAFVADFLAMRPKPIVNTDATQIDQPNMRENADLPPAQMAQIDMMVAALPNLSDVQRAEVKKNMINGRRAIAAGASNGSPGRY